ncbi:hypothetical protein [Thermococcus sp.]|uniref:hypothetical protein n=1 Tax=Thermococcus sp. TaxID=35749 RepID=UPI0025EB0F51|nr:hypothetical protein [Thermococcus sp.]
MILGYLGKILRVLSVLFSTYFLFTGLKLHGRESAVAYLFPALFWGGYYWLFRREVIIDEEKHDKPEVAAFLIWMLVLVGLMEYTFFITNSASKFFVSLIAALAVAVLFPFKLVKRCCERLFSLNELVTLLLFGSLGLLFLFLIQFPLSLSYFTMFLAIGATVYEWDYDKNTREKTPMGR